jgi:hypothetical protein
MSSRDLHLELLENIILFRRLQLILGDNLLKLRQGEKYMKAVGSIDSWSEYLSQPEIGMSVAEANSLINVFRFAIGRLTVEDHLQIPFATLKEMLKHDDESGEMIEAAKNLSTKDFRDRYYEYTHDEEPATDFTYMVMKRSADTGNLKKVHGIESEEILNVFKDQITE